MRKKKTAVIFSLLFLLLAGSLLAGLLLGSADFRPEDLWDGLFGTKKNPSVSLIVLDLRLPRVIGALFAGGGLAVAGLLLQTATNNDLCSPNVIGVNAGAGFAVMLLLCLFPMAYPFLPAAAFAGAMCTTMTVLGLSFSKRQIYARTTVILAGVAVAALFNAGISFLSQLYPEALSSYASFSAGGFSGVYKEDLPLPCAMILIGILCAWLLSSRLNLLCLGDELAQSLGVRVRLVRFLSLVLSSLLCAAVVSYAGLLGFAGLIVPHIARRLLGQDIRILVPFCAFAGGLLVILSDLAARTLFAPSELPAGILMAGLGAPFFLYLLIRRKKDGV